MFCLHRLARAVWPFLVDARKIMRTWPGMTNGGAGLEARGIVITFVPNSKGRDKLSIKVTNLSTEQVDIYVFGLQNELRYHDTPRHRKRGRWPLPWLLRGPMREIYNKAYYSEYGFS